MYLLDTNVLSEIVKPTPDAGVMAKLGTQERASLFASVLTRFEFRRGASLRPDKAIWERLEKDVLPIVSWLDVNVRIAEQAGEIAASLQRQGRASADEVDPIVAATALVHNLVLVTRNQRDFEHIPGLRLENWFSAP